jgi:peptide chain release factor 1
MVTTTTININIKDVRTEWFSGTGAGGQHRNKHQNSCRLIHTPTGIVVTSQQRKRDQSFTTAWSELERRVQSDAQSADAATTSSLRSSLTGSGMRADKIRTYRFQDDQVKDHTSHKAAKVSQVMKGNFPLLH